MTCRLSLVCWSASSIRKHQTSPTCLTPRTFALLLAGPNSADRPVVVKGGGLSHGNRHARQIDLRRLAHGALTPVLGSWVGSSSGLWQSVCDGPVSGAIDQQSIHLQHKLQEQLLGVRALL